MKEKEIFKQLEEFPDYDFGSHGTIISYKTKNPRKIIPKIDKNGYHEVGLRDYTNKRKYRKAHRLILLAHNHIENSENMQVNHINGKPDDNRLSNLEWCTSKENMKHAYNILSKNKDNNKFKIEVLIKDKNDNIFNFESMSKASVFIKSSVGGLRSFWVRRKRPINEFIKYKDYDIMFKPSENWIKEYGKEIV